MLWCPTKETGWFDRAVRTTDLCRLTQRSMKVIKEMVIATIQIHLANDPSTHRIYRNPVTIAPSVTTVDHHRADDTRNRHGVAVQAVAVIAAVIRANLNDLESIRDVNAHLPMIAQVNRAKVATTNAINTQEKKPTPEVTATKEVATEFLFLSPCNRVS